MAITYKVNHPISTEQFITLLSESTLGKRRPINDRECIQGMISNSNLIITAWDFDNLVGISRCLTDFHYACYLSDLAVSKKYQKKGIGKQLQIHTKKQLGPHCKLVLLAAPAANSYYQHMGFKHNPRCWVMEPDAEIDT